MPTSLRRWLLPMIMLLALAVRSYGLFAPLLDTHSWRQADTAAIARNFVASGYSFGHPQVDWGGATPGYVESEFPLYTGMLALLFGTFGSHAWLGRLLTALISAATPVALYCLIRGLEPASLRQRRIALYAALALCIMPFPVYFGRAVMPDSLMLLGAVLAIWTFQRWLAVPTWPRFALALLCGVLAPLAKTPNLVILAVPLAYLVLAYQSFRRWPQLLVYAAGFALPALLWTRYAAALPSDPRLSFGIGEKLLDLRLLSDPQFYLLIGRWAVDDVLTWVGLPLVAVGLVASVTSMRRAHAAWLLPMSWLLGVLAFVLIGAAGVVGQDYYLLPLAGPCAWLIGLGLERAQQWALARWPRVAAALPVVLLVALAALSVLRIAPMYRTAEFYRQLGQRLDLALPEGERVGVIAPAVSEILYYSERKGWRLDPGVIVPGGLASLGPDLGVRYLLIADPWLTERRELLTEELRAYRRVPAGPYALLLDLQQPGYTVPFELVWETGHVVAEPFLSAWKQLGGTDTTGFPISDALPEDGEHVQYFERVVLRESAGVVTLAPAGRDMLAQTGGVPQPAPVEGAFAEAWEGLGGDMLLGPPISPPINEQGGLRQYFEHGVLEQQGDGNVQLGAVGRWLLDARGLTEERQISLAATQKGE